MPTNRLRAKLQTRPTAGQIVDLDPLDIRILKALQQDARLSFRELGRQTRASVPTVSAHVHRLERLGVLRGYRADVDPLQLGETSVFLVVEAAAGQTGKVASAVARLPEVRRTMETREGRIVAEAILPRENEAARFLRKVGKLRGVVAYEHHLASGRVKDEPRAHVAHGVQVLVACFECGKTIEGAPVIRRLDRREHYFCCRTCEAQFVDRYRRLKAAA